MGLCKRLHNGQPQARTIIALSVCFTFVEDILLHIFRYTLAVVAYPAGDAIVIHSVFRTDGDDAIRGVLQFMFTPSRRVKETCSFMVFRVK